MQFLDSVIVLNVSTFVCSLELCSGQKLAHFALRMYCEMHFGVILFLIRTYASVILIKVCVFFLILKPLFWILFAKTQCTSLSHSEAYSIKFDHSIKQIKVTHYSQSFKILSEMVLNQKIKVFAKYEQSIHHPNNIQQNKERR